MKRLLLITILTLLTFNTITSQEVDKKKNLKEKFRFGVVGGLDLFNLGNQAAIAGDFSMGSNNKIFSEQPKYYLGFFTEKKIAKNFLVRSEVLYSFGTHSDFIEVPLFVEYKLNKKFDFYSGIQFNFMLEEKNEYFKRESFGLNSGLQYNLSDNFFIDLRYVHKFSQQIEPESYPLEFKKKSIKTFRLGIGYKF